MKQCTKCKRLLELESFSRQAASRDGYYCWCKECDAAKKRAYRLRNADRIREKNRRYEAANPERSREWHLAAGRRYRKRHPDRMKASTKKWRELNPDRVREFTKKWRNDNPDRVREHRKKNREGHSDRIREYMKQWKTTPKGKASRRADGHRRRVSMRADSGAMRSEEVRQILAARRCYICGERFTKTNPATLDHVMALSAGGPHVSSNLAAAHQSCNSRKHVGKTNPVTGQGLLL